MHKQKSIIGGLILIAAGAFILLAQTVPGFADFLDMGRQWPLIIVAIGSLFFVGAFLGTAELAIPGSIITGLGLLFYYQNLSGNWASWAYAWALIPGFVGIGMLITGTLDKTQREMRADGRRLILISTILFLVFGAFFNFPAGLGRFWPVLLIIGGLYLLFRNRRTRDGLK
jgi:hypothetical protein